MKKNKHTENKFLLAKISWILAADLAICGSQVCVHLVGTQKTVYCDAVLINEPVHEKTNNLGSDQA